MKKTLLAIFVLALVGCNNSYKETDFPVRPKELEDCKFYLLKNEDGAAVRVVRCPNAITSATYSQGKTQATTITINGSEYVKKEKQ